MVTRLTRAAALAVVALMALAASVQVSRAAFVRTTSSGGNSVTALTVAPPTNVNAALSLNGIPNLGTCRASLTWTASTTAGVTTYEVVRVVASTGVVAAGPFTVAGTAYVDSPVPLQVLGNSYQWRVRSVLGTWRSAYQTANASNIAACLL